MKQALRDSEPVRASVLSHDRTARRMLRDVQDAPPVMTDDEEAVEHAEGNRVGTVKKPIAAIASRSFLPTAPTARLLT